MPLLLTPEIRDWTLRIGYGFSGFRSRHDFQSARVKPRENGSALLAHLQTPVPERDDAWHDMLYERLFCTVRDVQSQDLTPLAQRLHANSRPNTEDSAGIVELIWFVHWEVAWVTEALQDYYQVYAENYRPFLTPTTGRACAPWWP